MGRLMVYFANGCKAEFDADKAIFNDHDTMFMLCETHAVLFDASEFEKKNESLINWSNVCFVRNIEEKDRDDE